MFKYFIWFHVQKHFYPISDNLTFLHFKIIWIKSAKVKIIDIKSWWHIDLSKNRIVNIVDISINQWSWEVLIDLFLDRSA